MPTGTAAQRIIEIDGSELDPDVEAALESALVVDRLAMPDMFQLVFRDPARDVLATAGLTIGAGVVISTSSVDSDAPATLIDGEVTSIEAEYDSLGTRAVVRGYDRSHRLAAGRRTQTFQNVKYSDIAQQIAGDAGLSADVDDSGGTLEHVLQANQSDLDFLYGLAKRIGFDCRVDGEKLLFKKPTTTSGAPDAGEFDGDDPTQLVWNDTLLEFRARMSAVGQVKTVKVRGWDVTKKEAVIGEADVEATNAELSMTNADLADKVHGDTLVVVDHPVEAQDAADQLAAARAEQVGSAAFEATAVAMGSPALKSGVAVHVSGVDEALEGKWVISSSRHEFGNGPYRTALEFSGRQDRSLGGVVTGGVAGGMAGSAAIPGVVPAIVTDNDDPDEQGRVKVQYPWLADEAESFWARVMAPGASKQAGVVWMPSVGDEVLVAFEMGDVSRPMVLGGLWNGQDVTPFQVDNHLDAGTVTYVGFVSRTGHQISFYESDSDASIQLLTANGVIDITLDEKNKQLRISSEGKVTVEAKGDIEFTTDGAFKVKAKSSLSLEADGQVKIKGATVALN